MNYNVIFELELLTANMPLSDLHACFYYLKEEFLIRKWSNTGIVLLNKNSLELKYLNKNEEAAVLYANGKINYNLPVIPQKVRIAANELKKQGFLNVGRKNLSDEQLIKAYDNKYIPSVKWIITENCNYKCKHCFLSAPSAAFHQQTTEECLSLIDDIAASGIYEIRLSGGEPLIRHDIYILMEHMRTKGLIITQISSNGSLITEELLDKLDELDFKPDFHISFDGVGHHDWLRGIKGAEKTVLLKHMLLHSRGFESTSAIALYKGNIDTFRQSVNTLAAAGCENILVNRIYSAGEWLKNNNADIELSPSDYANVCLEYLPMYFEDGQPVNLAFNPLVYLRKNCQPVFPIIKQTDTSTDQRVCGAMEKMPVISADGRLLPCYMMSGFDIAKTMPMISVLGFKETLENSIYSASVNKTISDYYKENPECLDCLYAKNCAAGCRVNSFLTSGDKYLGKDTVACEYYKSGSVWKIKEKADELFKKQNINKNTVAVI